VICMHSHIDHFGGVKGIVRQEEVDAGRVPIIAPESPDLVGALTVEQVLDSIAIRIDGPRAWDEHIVLSLVMADSDTTYIAELRNGALNQRTPTAPAAGSTTLTLTRPTLIALVTGGLDLPTATADGTTIDGDLSHLQRLVDLLAP
jgi:alkyl sulfatase BDS1-like metallo-beta-lactamase superfamily hydrolase